MARRAVLHCGRVSMRPFNQCMRSGARRRSRLPTATAGLVDLVVVRVRVRVGGVDEVVVVAAVDEVVVVAAVAAP